MFVSSVGQSSADEVQERADYIRDNKVVQTVTSFWTKKKKNLEYKFQYHTF